VGVSGEPGENESEVQGAGSEAGTAASAQGNFSVAQFQQLDNQ